MFAAMFVAARDPIRRVAAAMVALAAGAAAITACGGGTAPQADPRVTIAAVPAVPSEAAPPAPPATMDLPPMEVDPSADWRFTDVTAAAGISFTHGYSTTIVTEPMVMCGGVAVGDYDGDGWMDLFVVAGDGGTDALYRNRADHTGAFEEVGERAGVAFRGTVGCGPKFADLDGDGWLDLFVGGVDGTRPRILRNQGDGTFRDVTAGSGVATPRDTFSTAIGDYDRDGDLDLYLVHWGSDTQPDVLWRNDGGGTFTNVDAQAGIDWRLFGSWQSNLSANFAEIDGDGWPDLLVASDFQTSRVLVNEGGAALRNLTDVKVITDENGMGSAVGDYDNDGDLDWFVTSVWDPVKGDSNWGETGNRLYRNRGDGTFEDATDEAGVREGYWGWAACFADFNNDGWLDIFHVNGFSENRGQRFKGKFDLWRDDPARLFVADGDGTFTERAAEVGLDDRGQGRGASCFDYDRDGDVDVFIANNQQPPKLYRNDGGNRRGRFLQLRLRGRSPNTEGAGGRVYVKTGPLTQMRELRVSDNYLSQDPVWAHFGVGDVFSADEVRVVWPSGEEAVSRRVAANQSVVLEEP